MATEIEAPAVTSILSADFGSVNTRTVLFDVVGGEYRLVSRAQSLTTDAPPLVDVGIGLRRTLDEMTSLTGRNLLNGEEIMIGQRPDGSGVDMFLATASGGRPMKTVLVGLMPDVSIATARRALGSTYVDLVDTLSLADVRRTEDQVNAILRHQPDLIFVVGGTNYGATESVLSLLQTVRLAVLLARGTKPVVLYAGNEALRQTVRDLLGSEVSLFMAGNVRPTLLEERPAPAQLELAMVYGTYKSNNAGGFAEVQKTARLGVLPTAQSYSNVVRYLGELPGSGIGVICVDVGSSTVTVCATVRKQPYITIRSDLGLGHSAVSGVKAVGAKNIVRWLTFRASESDVMDYAYNKTLRPSTVPQSSEDLEMEYAITRELLRTGVAGARTAWRGVPRSDLLPAMRPIIGAGSVLAQAVDPGIGALLLLDALQPVGISELRLDPYGVIAALGGVAYVEPLAVVHVLETGGLVNLGTAVSPLGRTRSANAMQVVVRTTNRTVQHTVASGAVNVIDLPSGQKAQVKIKLSSGLTLNGKREVTLNLEGGAVGLILDGRGRPFSPPKELERRAQVLPRWYAAVRSDNKG